MTWALSTRQTSTEVDSELVIQKGKKGAHFLFSGGDRVHGQLAEYLTHR